MLLRDRGRPRMRRALRVVFPTAAAMAMSTATAASTIAGKPYVIAVDGVAAASAQDSKSFLLSKPGGAYTTARTCRNGRSVFEWETHVERTAASVEAMLDGKSAPALRAALASAPALRPRLDATVATAMREFLSSQSSDTDELKLTVVVNWDEAAEACAEPSALGSIACHVAPLPRLPEPPIRVEVRGAPRANALAKDSSWVSDRAPLEALMKAAAVGAVNELLLATDAGELLEGSQTNFYAVLDGAVHTAGEGILQGTVRRLLLEVCEREGIPVVLAPPRLADAGRWEGALISSTSRLLLPIDELYAPAEGEPTGEPDLRRTFDNGAGKEGGGGPPASLAARLQALVQREVESHSTEML